MAVQLQPVSPPMGPNLGYCVNKTTVLTMKEKVWSLSGDTFTITDEHDQVVVQCNGTTFSMSDRKEFLAPNGQPLFSLRNKLLSIHKSFYAEGAGGEIVFEVKSKFSLLKSKMRATFINASDKQPVELEVRGDWLDRSATITDLKNGRVVAQISRSRFNMREILGGQQSYYVAVAPGVDLSLMAAICVCLDEKENEKK